jgi:hypothetical protein
MDRPQSSSGDFDRRSRSSRHLTKAKTAASFAVLFALVATATSTTAQVPNGPVGLKRVGPLDPTLGFPAWYEDTSGLKLGVCKDPGRCFFRADPLRPVSFPQTEAQVLAGDFNFPDEMFYYAIENLEIAPLPARARVLYHVAIEGAFASGDVQLGQQVVFARLRIRLRDLVPESTYTIRHPYGAEVLETDVDGGVFYTRDLGLAVGNFQGALYGDIGPFLVPTGFDRNAPKGTFLSDGGLTLETLEGSPIGRNFVEYEGPGLTTLFPALVVAELPDTIRSTTFSMQGQVAEQYGVGIDNAYYSATGDAASSSMSTAVTVFAQSAEGQSLIARAQDGTFVPMQENGTSGHYFAQIDLGGANASLPANLEVHNVSDTPLTQATRANLTDLVTVQSAVYTLGTTTAPGNLVVQLVSTDKSTSRTMDVDLADFVVSPVLTGGQGDASVSQPVPATYVPPEQIVVRSSAGGITVAPLQIVGAGKSTQDPQVPGPTADAGLDQAVDIRTVVTLSGANSQGLVTQFLWAPPTAGFEIDNVNSQGAILQGTVTQAGDLSFRLTVIDQYGRASEDTVVVHVTDPNVVIDVVAVTAARYDNGKGLWDVAGTSDVQWDQRIDVYLALLDGNGQTVLVNGLPVKDPARHLGATFVGDLGFWRYRAPTSTFRPEAIPTAQDQFVVVESSLQGTASFRFRVTR